MISEDLMAHTRELNAVRARHSKLKGEVTTKQQELSDLKSRVECVRQSSEAEHEKQAANRTEFATIEANKKARKP